MIIYLWITFGSILFILAALYLIGFILPEKFTGSVNVVIHAPEKSVWAAILDTEKNPMNRPLINRVDPEMDNFGCPTWIEYTGYTRNLIKTVEATPPLYIHRTMNDLINPSTGEFEARLMHDPAGCRVAASRVLVLCNGHWKVPIYRLLLFFSGGMKKDLETYFYRLAAQMGVKAEFQ